MYSRVVLLCTAVALLAAAPAGAAVKPGADLPGAFRPLNVAGGKFEGQFHCLVCEHGLNPGVLIFAQDPKTGDAKDPLPRLLQQLDQYATENPRTRLRAFAVFHYPDLPNVVTEDDVREGKEVAVADVRKRLGLQQMVLALDGLPALQKAGYDLDPKAQVVVVLYDRLKVLSVHSFADADALDKGIEKIMAEVTGKLAPVKK
jgi:hypothetical protein